MTDKNKKSKKQDNKRFLKSRVGRYLAIFLVSAWTFVLGVLVGRGTAPVKFDIDKLSQELAELRQKDIKEQMERLKIEAEELKPKTDLEFYEELKKTPQQLKRKIMPPPKTPDATRKDTSSKRAAAGKPPSADTSAGSSAPPQAEPAPSRPQSSSRKAPTEKNLTIQAASLKEMKAADELVARLKKKGYPAYKTIGVVPDKGIWFRVRIGEYGSPADAVGTLQRLKKDGFEPILVQK